MAKKRNKPKSHKITLLGKKYTFRKVPYLGNLNGDCDPPDAIDKTIRVQSGLKDKDELECCLHEFLHAIDWSKDETWVEQAACDISLILWKLGWRKK